MPIRYPAYQCAGTCTDSDQIAPAATSASPFQRWVSTRTRPDRDGAGHDAEQRDDLTTYTKAGADRRAERGRIDAPDPIGVLVGEEPVELDALDDRPDPSAARSVFSSATAASMRSRSASIERGPSAMQLSEPPRSCLLPACTFQRRPAALSAWVPANAASPTCRRTPRPGVSQQAPSALGTMPSSHSTAAITSWSASPRAAWARSSARATRCWRARWRSRCSTARSPATSRSSTASNRSTRRRGLSHTNIVAVFDWGAVDGIYYMVMEHVRGQGLPRC